MLKKLTFILFTLALSLPCFADECREKKFETEQLTKEINLVNAQLGAEGDAANKMSLQSSEQIKAHQTMIALLQRADRLQGQLDVLKRQLKSCQ